MTQRSQLEIYKCALNTHSYLFIFGDSFPNCFSRHPALDVNPETAGITEKITGSGRETLCDSSPSLLWKCLTFRVASLFGIIRFSVQLQSSHPMQTIDCLTENEHLPLIFTRREKSKVGFLRFLYSLLFRSATHKALFSEVTSHGISGDWCHERCQEESVGSAGFSIFNGVNGHLLSSDATAALFQMEAHVTPRLIMPATSREARAQRPWLLSQKVRLELTYNHNESWESYSKRMLSISPWDQPENPPVAVLLNWTRSANATFAAICTGARDPERSQQQQATS